LDLVRTFIASRFKDTERFKRRLDKIAALENKEKLPKD
jgi:ribose 5-phosphate isomerase RpiB